MRPACAHCERSGGSEACAALYHRLLALEFQHAEPWGRLHGVTVPAFALQHPSLFDVDDPAPWLASLHVYVVHGLASAERMWAAHRGQGPPAVSDLPPMRPGVDRFSVTIADVAGPGGDFPADRHLKRVDRWVHRTYADLVGDPSDST